MSQNAASTSGADTIVGLGNVFGLEGMTASSAAPNWMPCSATRETTRCSVMPATTASTAARTTTPPSETRAPIWRSDGAGAIPVRQLQDNDTLYGGLVLTIRNQLDRSRRRLRRRFVRDGRTDEVLFGNRDDDVIHAGGGIDTVYGGKGNDVPWNGDAGDDLLIGGEGATPSMAAAASIMRSAGSASGVYDAGGMGAVIVTHDGGVDTVYENDVERAGLGRGGALVQFLRSRSRSRRRRPDLRRASCERPQREIGNWMFGDGTTSGNPANHVSFAKPTIAASTSIWSSLPDQIQNSIRPRSIAFDGIEATVVTDIAGGCTGDAEFVGCQPKPWRAQPALGGRNRQWSRPWSRS